MTGVIPESVYLTHRVHVWYIYLHWVDIYGKCRDVYHTWILWVRKSPVVLCEIAIVFWNFPWWKKCVGKPECVQFSYEVISLNPKEVSADFFKKSMNYNIGVWCWIHSINIQVGFNELFTETTLSILCCLRIDKIVTLKMESMTHLIYNKKTSYCILGGSSPILLRILTDLTNHGY